MHFGSFINSLGFGKAQETNAIRYLRAHGLRLIDRNYRSRYGEIDLIMLEAETLVFVEVRYRRNPEFGGAAASVTAAKQRRIRLTAAQYLQSQPRLQRSPCRFDVLGLCHGRELDLSSKQLQFDWIKNAFE